MQKIKIFFMQILKSYSMVSYASFLIYRGIILFIGTPLLPLPVFSTSSFFFFFCEMIERVGAYGNMAMSSPSNLLLQRIVARRTILMICHDNFHDSFQQRSLRKFV